MRSGQKERALEYFADSNVVRLGGWPVVRREDLDGIKLYVGDVGWVMVRASGTENMLRVYSETTRVENTQRLLNEVSALVQAV